MSFQIRRAAKEDAPDIGRIHVEATRHAYRDIYTDDYLNNLSAENQAKRWVEEGKGLLVINDPNSAVFVAIHDDKVIGFAGFGPSRFPEFSQHGELYAIYLDPAFIGCGVGSALFKSCLHHAKEHGFSAIITRVLSKNTKARHFYECTQAIALPETEQLIETGGVRENIITYQWLLT